MNAPRTNERTPATPATAKVAVDWTEIRARVERAGRPESREITAAHQREILRRRALAVANPPPDFTASGDEAGGTEMLVFQLSGESYAVEAAAVVEALPAPTLAPLPGLPPRFRGLANVRSRIVPAFDLRVFFALSPRPASAGREMLLTLRQQGAEFGLLVDAVLGVRRINSGQVRQDITGLPAAYLRGVAEGGLVLLELPGLAAALAIAAR